MAVVNPAQPTATVASRSTGPAHIKFGPVLDPMRLLLCGLIVISLSKIHALFPILVVLRLGLLLAFLCLLYAVANPKALAAGKLLATWPARIIALLGLMSCLSVPFGLSMGGSAVFILTEYDKTLILAFLVIAAIRTAADLLTFVWSVVIATGCLAYLAIFVYHVRMERTGIARISGGFSYDANDICVIGLIGLAMALLAFQVSRIRGKVICIIIMLMIGMMIARSGSRGGFIGLVAVGGALFVMVRTVSMDRKLAVVGVLVFGVFLSAPEGYMTQMLTILHPTEDYNYNSATGRVEIWKRGMTYMFTHPVTGIGVDNFQRAEGTIAERAIQAHTEEYTGVRWSAAHSTLVQAGAEMGIPGLILMAILMYRGIWEIYKIRKKMPMAWIKGTPEERFLYQTSVFLPVALVGFGVSGLLVSHAYLEPIYVLGGLQAGFYNIIAKKLKGGQAARQEVVVPVRRYRGGLAPNVGAAPILPPAQP